MIWYAMYIDAYVGTITLSNSIPSPHLSNARAEILVMVIGMDTLEELQQEVQAEFSVASTGKEF